MPSPHTFERQRGIKEAGQQLGALRERWPLAFPAKPHSIRPLAIRAAGEIDAIRVLWAPRLRDLLVELGR